MTFPLNRGCFCGFLDNKTTGDRGQRGHEMKKDLRSENVKKIAEVFPMCITEIRDKDGNLKKVVDFEKLKDLFSDDIREKEEAYEFTWAGKREALHKAFESNDKILRPVVEDSLNFFDTQNIYIEGDNLDVLRILRRSYFEKIKMIYIDPPYNTGHDFIYNDNFKKSKEEEEEELGLWDEEDNMLFENKESNGKFHSDWCSMIYSRLLLARDLLRPDGVIFISIDDNEVASLRKICDEVFGEDNFKNLFLVRRRIKSLNLQFADNGLKKFNIGCEYILCYSKTDKFLFNPIRMTKSITPEKGIWNVFWSNADRPTMRYDILGFTPKTGQWRWQKELAEEAINNYEEYLNNYSDKMSLEEYWRVNGSKMKFIRRIPNGTGKNGGVQYWTAPSDTALRTSNWTDLEVSQIAKDFNLYFDNPKNVNLIRTIVSSTPPPRVA